MKYVETMTCVEKRCHRHVFPLPALGAALALLLLLLPIGKALATTYYVRTSGDDGNSGTTPAAAWKTFAKATSSTSPGDVVWFGGGNYNEEVQPTVDGTAGNPIRFVADTGGTITGDSGSVTIFGDDDKGIVLDGAGDYLEFEGFRITGTGGKEGIKVKNVVGVMLIKCEIYAKSEGIKIEGTSTCTITNCLIHDNTKNGIICKRGTLTVWNCTIEGNADAGIETGSKGPVDATITNSIIANNSGNGLNRRAGTMTHTYNLVFGNGRNFKGTSQSTGEVVADPLFTGASDYHLLEGSPAIDAGTDASAVLNDDLECNSRPLRSGWDMGCYELPEVISYTDLVDAYTSNSPVAWWRLNEDSGASVAFDEMSSNNGLYSGGAAAGLFGAPIGGVNAATHLDGTNDYISAGTMDVIPSGSAGCQAGMSIIGWFKADAFAAGEAKILAKASGTDEASHYWTLGVNNTGSGVRLQFRLKTGGTTSTLTASSGNLAAGAWVFAAAVYDGSNMTLYKDGVAVGQVAKSGTPDTDATVKLWLGGNPSGATDQPFDGLIDEVAVFDKILSPTHIAAIYAGSLRGRGNGKVVIPTIWGVDSDDVDLFTIDDYTDPASGTTTFGPLKWNDGGTPTELTGKVQAMAIDKSARMYLVSDTALGTVSAPVLLRMNLENATQSGDNMVTVIGEMGTGTIVRGLAIDPLNDDLYAIRSNGRLYIIDKKDGSVLSDLGIVAGQGETIGAAQDLTFDEMGNLYVIDNTDDEIYRVDKTTAEILEVYADGNSGIGTMQGLAWDHLNQRILATDTAGDDLHYSSLSGYGAASTVSLSAQALTDVEAISFMPSEGVKGGAPGVRILRWVEIK